jgi:hypothetical protein
MLSEDMTRYVDLHRGFGFRFHTRHGLSRNFVVFAESQEHTFIHPLLARSRPGQSRTPERVKDRTGDQHRPSPHGSLRRSGRPAQTVFNLSIRDSGAFREQADRPA